MPICTFAVPAKQGINRILTLTDGTTVSATLVGDEFAHYWVDADGHAYQAINDDVYKRIDLQAVMQRADVVRSTENQQRKRRLAQRKAGEVESLIGKKKGLIILVNFSDVAFQSANNKTLYQRIANEKNFSYGKFKGSMYDYFYDQSEGKFELAFDVVGPVKVSKQRSYYGENRNDDKVGGNDKHAAEMVIEAIRLADPQVNFANYDWDGDGMVEQVYVIYAGKGEADSGIASTIWPHKWNLYSASFYDDGDGRQKLDGVWINTYACGGELNGSGNIAGIGTMCHEFSHCLGFPDFYDTDYSGGQGMFMWDLMDQGNYNGDGYCPAGYTSYERWLAGWKEPVELDNFQNVSNMAALQDYGSKTYIIYNKGNRDEFFLLENRQKTKWDTDLPGSGLLILHVDYDETAWSSHKPNDDPNHQRLTWIPADNQYQYSYSNNRKYYTKDGAASDPFPYGSVNAFGKNTTPAAKLYNKNSDGTYYLDSSVENITRNSNGTISFSFKPRDNSPAISFADDNVKKICVDNWDTNKDGELSKAEAAKVTDLGTVFQDNKSITTFNELQYFTGLTSIGEHAFRSCHNLTHITIPNNVTTIEDGAFYYSDNLKSVNIPNGVTTIGSSAFNYCLGLTSITIPNSVISIYGYAFYNCSGLRFVTIPSSVKSIGSYAFTYCSGLTSIKVEEGNSKYDSRNNCNAIIETASNILIAGCKNTIIPNTVTSINNSAFSGCSGLTSITIPSGVKIIRYSAFSKCNNLKSVISKIQEPFTFDEGAFNDISSTCKLTVPSGTRNAYISKGWTTDVFKGGVIEMSELGSLYCDDVTVKAGGETAYLEVMLNTDDVAAISGINFFFSLPQGVNIAQVYNEEEDDWVEDVTFPIAKKAHSCGIIVEYTGGYLIYLGGDNSLRFKAATNPVVRIGIKADEEAAEGTYDINFVKAIMADRSVPAQSFVVADFTAKLTIIGTNIIFADDNVKKICVDNWDSNQDGELSEKEAAKVTDLGYVFYRKDITSFNELQYFTGLTSIGSGAFSGCSSLTSITIPDNVTRIGSDAFEGCSGLTSITIPNSVTSIGGYAFNDCSSLTSIIVGNGVKDLVGYAFFGCNSLISIKVADENATYDSRCDCNAIIETATNTLIVGCQNTVIPEDVTNIGNSAFRDCIALTSITIPNSVTTIGNSAFDGCSGLTSITIPNSVTKIGDFAFYDCSGLTSITIPNSVTDIGEVAFLGCSSLTSIKVETGNVTYDSRNDCNAIIETETNSLILGCQNTIIPGTVTSIGDYAFSHCSGLKSVTIPNSVTSIGEEAFFECHGLTSVIIGSGVTSIGEDAFRECNRLIYVKVKNPRPAKYGKGAFSGKGDIILYVPVGSKAAYEAADYWNEFKEIIEVTDDEIYLANIEGISGRQVTLPIALKNENQIAGLQMDLYLPEGMTVAKNSRGKLIIEVTDRMDESHTVSGEVSESGIVHIVVNSLNNDAITGDNGDILNVTINIDESLAGGEYIVQLKDIVLSDVNNTESHPNNAEATIKVIQLGDVDCSGAANINDVVCIINHILNRQTGTFLHAAADVDNNGSININDVVVLIDKFILHRNNTPRGATKQKVESSEITDRLYLDDFHIFEGDTLEIAVQLSNTHEVRAVQGNIKLPEGFSFVMKSNDRLDVKNLNERSEGFSLSCTLQEDGSMTFTHLSIDSYAYMGNEGGIFTFKVTANANIQSDKYEVSLKDVVLSINGEAYEQPDSNSSILADRIEAMIATEVIGSDYFDIQGRRLSAPQKGINIIHYSDGTTKKILIK